MARWALLATLLAVVVIMLGAWTRLVHAGLGCPDWPGCYGFLTVPQDAASIAIAEARFPDSPVDVSKGWPEMIHRYAAGLLGLVVFGLAFYGFRHRHEGVPYKLPLALAAFILLQGAFGAWTVTLKLWPQVVAAHLLGGFTTLTLLTLLTLRLWGRRSERTPVAIPAVARLRPWLYGGIALVVMQIALGAWTAANYAAVACTDLPTCQGQWWPEMDFAHGFDITQSVGPNYLGGQLAAEGRVAIHVTHRIGAVVVLVYLAALFAALWRHGRQARLGGAITLAASALVGQILLGLANVLLSVPLAVAVAHNALGAGLLLTLVYLMWRLHGYHLGIQVRPTTIKNEATA
ncbi:MAG: COX15/CtaA family protein [Marinobacter sp.]|uniref:COX15/CtaA family protein n=1 Tax=Marinobacter sp. TaxID=50741 RepID=UPI00299D9487|nr:COX15/CtaA family protein [Marinobacter sp.]MDX1634155.1 COX15/CtaA family protein [Marinobacter sp.]